jgi:hypothetical protein
VPNGGLRMNSNEQVGSSGNAPHLYLSSTHFESCLRHRLSAQDFFDVLLRSPRNAGITLHIREDCCHPLLFQLIRRRYPTIRCYTVRVVGDVLK